MGNFRFGGNRDGGRPRSGGGRFEGRGRDSGRDRDFRDSDRKRPLEMHEVTCDKCGKQCEVPFRPKGDKPVYCSDCFQKPTGEGRRDSGRSSGGSSVDLSEVNRKLDKIMQALDIE